MNLPCDAGAAGYILGRGTKIPRGHGTIKPAPHLCATMRVRVLQQDPAL